MEGIEEKKTTFVYLADEELGWVPAKLVDNTAIISNNTNANNITTSGHDNESDDKDEESTLLSIHSTASTKVTTTVTATANSNRSIDASQEMLLQCVDSDSNLIICPDMRDLPYLHEASILYNLKYRYEGISSSSSTKTTITSASSTSSTSLPLSKESSSNGKESLSPNRPNRPNKTSSSLLGVSSLVPTHCHPYTRSGEMVVAINPYQWIEGLYANQTRSLYADRLVWRGNTAALSNLEPHIYEISSLSFKGIITDTKGQDQSIIVSGEAGSGKTVSVKILMSHLTTFHPKRDVYVAETIAPTEPIDVDIESNTNTTTDNNSDDSADATNNSSTERKDQDHNLIHHIANFFATVFRQTPTTTIPTTTTTATSLTNAIDHPTESEPNPQSPPEDIESNIPKSTTNSTTTATIPTTPTTPTVPTPSTPQRAAAGAAPPPTPPIINEEPQEMKQTNRIVQRVLDSNPLLEAFGNAKTERNDNSSRFSKYVQLQFHVQSQSEQQQEQQQQQGQGQSTTSTSTTTDLTSHPSCNIAGSTCQTYLLEKSRVAKHYQGERTFHIFYQLLSASDTFKSSIWPGLVGKDESNFTYIGYNTTHEIDGHSDEQLWSQTLSALRSVGMERSKLTFLFQALCIVLLLGNLTFDVDPENEEGSIVSNVEDLAHLSSLLGIPTDTISHVLTHYTYDAVDDSYQVPLNTNAAKNTCDAWAKMVYCILFDWLVSCINDATSASKHYEGTLHDNESSSSSALPSSPSSSRSTTSQRIQYRHVSILDIFGFENLSHDNNFEQLLINHANERLQKNFTKDLIESVKVEYESEGISVTDVDYVDNSNIIRLLEGHLGLLQLLNEECIRPGGSDAGFVHKVYSNNACVRNPILVFKNRYNLSRTKTNFGIQHFAGTVDYDAIDFVEKNSDLLSEDVIQCCTSSTNPILRDGFLVQKTQVLKRRKGPKRSTLWKDFSVEMKSLFEEVSQTKTWYVRCINPNRHKLPGTLDMKYTLQQLQSSGILSALRMSRASFPNRLSFEYTLDRFWILASTALKVQKRWDDANFWNTIRRASHINNNNTQDNDRNDCAELLTQLLKPREFVSSTGHVTQAFVLGKSQVYFKVGALEYIEAERAKMFDKCAAIIQARIRGNKARAQFEIMLKDASKQPKEKRRSNDNDEPAWLQSPLGRIFVLLPLYLFRYAFGIVRRPFRHERGSWH